MEQYLGKIVNDTAKIFLFTQNKENPFVFYNKNPPADIQCQIESLARTINFEYDSSKLTVESKINLKTLHELVSQYSNLKFSNLGYDIDWYHDPEKLALSVGEGTDLALPKFLSKELDLSYDDLFKLDAHYKQGIEKINWGSKPFTHLFGIGYMALHINANKLQNYGIGIL